AFLRVPDAVRQQVEDYLQQLASVDVERVREPVHVENEREAARGRERLDRRAHVVDEPEYVHVFGVRRLTSRVQSRLCEDVIDQTLQRVCAALDTTHVLAPLVGHVSRTAREQQL